MRKTSNCWESSKHYSKLSNGKYRTVFHSFKSNKHLPVTPAFTSNATRVPKTALRENVKTLLRVSWANLLSTWQWSLEYQGKQEWDEETPQVQLWITIDFPPRKMSTHVYKETARHMGHMGHIWFALWPKNYSNDLKRSPDCYKSCWWD